MNIILGSRGMLGSMVAKVIPNSIKLNRPEFDASNLDTVDYAEGVKVINCIGLIKPYCDNVQEAIRVNALFPQGLPTGTIQIATDCVYSGKKGDYVETDPHDALDVYGKTKSLGEADHIHNLRCSIIGPEQQNHLSLLDWFLSQDQANGFTNHLWNGITTYHYAKIVKAVIENDVELPYLQHIVPADKVTKAELLRIIAKAYHRDIDITDVEAPKVIDRTLATSNPQFNKYLWELAGYPQPPTVKEMVEELAQL